MSVDLMAEINKINKFGQLRRVFLNELRARFELSYRSNFAFGQASLFFVSTILLVLLLLVYAIDNFLCVITLFALGDTSNDWSNFRCISPSSHAAISINRVNRMSYILSFQLLYASITYFHEKCLKNTAILSTRVV